MSTQDIAGEVRSTPQFDLECLFDDSEDPSELTVFAPETPDMTTEWITVDRSAAVPLDDVM